jgi:tRNA(Ile)-lysidine synthase
MGFSGLDPEPVRRFRDDLAALGAGGCGLGVAVSGGPDSLALLLLAVAACPREVSAATVDHGLRAQSRNEAEFVASVCARLGVRHHVLEVIVSPGASMQARARAARYAALARWQSDERLSLILTGHHQDDQAETLMMRLLRGSGVGGLAGIRPKSLVAGAAVGRPLLGWRRSELAGIVAAAGLRAVDDPSNCDQAYDRSRIRRRLASSPWIHVEALARSAAALAEAEEALEAMADRLARERIAADGAGFLLAPEDLPAELLRRLVLRCLRRIDPDAAPRGAQVVALIDVLRGGGASTLAGIKCVGGARFRFEKAPRRGKN